MRLKKSFWVTSLIFALLYIFIGLSTFLYMKVPLSFPTIILFFVGLIGTVIPPSALVSFFLNRKWSLWLRGALVGATVSLFLPLVVFNPFCAFLGPEGTPGFFAGLTCFLLIMFVVIALGGTTIMRYFIFILIWAFIGILIVGVIKQFKENKTMRGVLLIILIIFLLIASPLIFFRVKLFDEPQLGKEPYCSNVKLEIEDISCDMRVCHYTQGTNCTYVTFVIKNAGSQIIEEISYAFENSTNNLDLETREKLMLGPGAKLTVENDFSPYLRKYDIIRILPIIPAEKNIENCYTKKCLPRTCYTKQIIIRNFSCSPQLNYSIDS